MAKITPKEQEKREAILKEWHTRKSAWEISREFNIHIDAVYDIADLHGYKFKGGRGKYRIDRDHKPEKKETPKPIIQRPEPVYSNSGNWQYQKL